MKYGRKPRHLDVIPHLASALASPLPAPPEQADWALSMPKHLGVMLNQELGDCTAAAWGHGMQVWTANANPPMVTLPDADILDLYEKTGGYVQGDPSTDQGADIQTVLQYLLGTGLAGNKLSAAAFIQPSNTSLVRSAINDAAFVYIGLNVPSYVQNLENAGSIWDVPGKSGIPADADTSIVGGHAVILPAYWADGSYTMISWGDFYTMSAAFFKAFVDEVYVLADSKWIDALGVDPNGKSLSALLQTLVQLGKNVSAAPNQVRARRRHRRKQRTQRV